MQAYALQTVLERLGHEAQVIRIPFVRPKASLVVMAKRLLKRPLGKYEGYLDFEGKSNEWLPIITQHITPFVENHMHWSKLYRDCSEISENDFDCICVGSDQIWRPKMLLCDVSNAFLSFAKDWGIKRIAYSASFGTDVWEYSKEETEICKALANKFMAISVREKGGVELCKRYLNVNAVHTLDPTMLLDCDDYSVLINEQPNENEGKTLFSYILDVSEQKNVLINGFAEANEMTVSKIDVEMGNKKCNLSARILPSVEFWLKSFRDADFVVTDSFHACVFSIIFKKQFAVIVNDARGAARFLSLLAMLGIEDRIVKNVDDLNQLKPIDYNAVYAEWMERKQYSYNYLRENLC